MSRGVRLSELADRLGAEVVGDGEFVVRAVRALGDAGAEDLSFLHNPKYVEDARSSRAGAILIADADALPGRNVLVCSEPYLALAKALELFYPAERPAAGIHPSAVVAEDVVVGASDRSVWWRRVPVSGGARSSARAVCSAKMSRLVLTV